MGPTRSRAPRTRSSPRTPPPADGFDLATLAGAPTVRTDDAGAWRFSALPAGRYRIAVLLEDARYAPDPRTARPADGIVLEPGADVVVPALALTTRIE